MRLARVKKLSGADTIFGVVFFFQRADITGKKNSKAWTRFQPTNSILHLQNADDYMVH
jgi:hypothetical protein